MRSLLFIVSGLLALSAAAQDRLQQSVEKIVRAYPLEGSVVGVCVKDLSGKTLASHNPEQRMMPASNRKLVTTGLALHALGPEHRFRTTLGYTGEIKDGTLTGDLYIIGGGDPTLASADSIALKADALFWKWKTLLKEAGIERIHGRIVGDGSAYEGPLEHPSWEYDDIGFYYGTGGSALSFYENAIDFTLAPGSVGMPVQLRQLYPETPWLQVENDSRTVPEGGNNLLFYTDDLSPKAGLRGTLAAGRAARTEHLANKFGALTCAYHFWKNLKDTGWEVTGGYADVDRRGRIRSGDFRVHEAAGKPVAIAATESGRLEDIVRITDWRSDNFYAEGLLRALGMAETGSAVYDSCMVAERRVLRSLGMDTETVALVDGSGLSRRNYVSPEWLADYLLAILRSPASASFLSCLPEPGQGTLRAVRLPQPGRVRMKSGSFGGTLCYSGYILDGQGRPEKVFCLFVNNALAPSPQLRTALTKIIALLME